jgi:hypothetical protein
VRDQADVSRPAAELDHVLAGEVVRQQVDFDSGCPDAVRLVCAQFRSAASALRSLVPLAVPAEWQRLVRRGRRRVVTGRAAIAQPQLDLARLPAATMNGRARTPRRTSVVEAVGLLERPSTTPVGGVHGALRERDRLGWKRRDPPRALDEQAELGRRARVEVS